MEIDYKKLEEGLKILNGHDAIDAEKEVRLTGDQTVNINASAMYQAALAARALGTNVEEIMNLPIKKFTSITAKVFVFLMGDVGEKV